MDVPSRMTVAQAAGYACVSETIIRGWLGDGLPHFRLGAKGRRGKIMIAVEDLDGWLAAFKVASKGPEPVKAPARSRHVSLKHLKTD